MNVAENFSPSFRGISGWGWTHTVHSDESKRLLVKWRASLETGQPLVAEARVRRADGQYRWMLHRNVRAR
jgi:PAS domain-containing protein